MSDKLVQLIQRLKQDAAAQKKKTAALSLLFLVLLVVVGRLFVGGDSTSTASAESIVVAPVAAPADPVVVQSVQTPTSVTPTGTADTRSAPDDRAAGRDAPRNVNMSGLPRTLARDPFRCPSWFNTVRRDDDRGGAAPRVSWLDRLSQQWSEYQVRKSATERLIDDRIAEMELQSTMTGPVNSAYISGRLVHEGDEIDGFSVSRIETRRVTLTFSGVSRTLTVR